MLEEEKPTLTILDHGKKEHKEEIALDLHGTSDRLLLPGHHFLR